MAQPANCCLAALGSIPAPWGAIRHGLHMKKRILSSSYPLEGNLGYRSLCAGKSINKIGHVMTQSK